MVAELPGKLTGTDLFSAAAGSLEVEDTFLVVVEPSMTHKMDYVEVLLGEHFAEILEADPDQRFDLHPDVEGPDRLDPASLLGEIELTVTFRIGHDHQQAQTRWQRWHEDGLGYVEETHDRAPALQAQVFSGRLPAQELPGQGAESTQIRVVRIDLELNAKATMGSAPEGGVASLEQVPHFSGKKRLVESGSQLLCRRADVRVTILFVELPGDLPATRRRLVNLSGGPGHDGSELLLGQRQDHGTADLPGGRVDHADVVAACHARPDLEDEALIFHRSRHPGRLNDRSP